MNEKLDTMLQEVNSMMHEVTGEAKWESHLSNDYRSVEKIFAGLQILSALFCSICARF